MIAHTVDVLRRNMQELRQTLHHVALAGTLGRQLQQVGIAGYNLVPGGPGHTGDITVQSLHLLRNDLKKRLTDGRGSLVNGLQHFRGLMGQVQVRQRQLVGMEGKDSVIIVI